ncbi:MAG: hypothetical protein ACRD8Z_13480 [Nitrososphaeraceae archaeon]
MTINAIRGAQEIGKNGRGDLREKRIYKHSLTIDSYTSLTIVDNVCLNTFSIFKYLANI